MAKKDKKAAERTARYAARQQAIKDAMTDSEWFLENGYTLPSEWAPGVPVITPHDAEVGLRKWAQALNVKIDEPILLPALAAKIHLRWILRDGGPLVLQEGKNPRIARDPNWTGRQAAALYPAWPLPAGSETYLVTPEGEPDVQPPAVQEAVLEQTWTPPPCISENSAPPEHAVPSDNEIRRKQLEREKIEDAMRRQEELRLLQLQNEKRFPAVRLTLDPTVEL